MSYQDVDAILGAYIPSTIKGVEPSTLKLVLLAIARHTNSKNDEHKAWPSLETLEELTQLAHSTISRAIDALDALGAFAEYDRGGGRKHSTYVLNMHKITGWHATDDNEGSFKDPSHSRVTCVSLEISSEVQVSKTPAGA